MVASKKLTNQDFYLYVGRHAIKVEKKIKPLKLEHIEVQLNKV